jgi:uncharacterized membrane protein HdeD (DUF308 family)
MSTPLLTDVDPSSPFGNLKRAVAETYGCNWFLYILSGILWLLLGFVALSYRPSSISVAVIFIAVAFWMGALSSFVIAYTLSGGWRVLAITFGILATFAAVGALVWPGPTLLIVAIFVAWYLLFSGIFELAVALSNTDVRGWWIRLISGIISIGLGAWAIGNPARSVLLLVTVIGIFAIFRGIADLIAGFQFHELRDEVDGS